MFDSCSCSCDYDGESPEFYNEKIVKANKEHICGECKKKIKKGEKYEIIAGKWEGDFLTHKQCLMCSQIRDDFKICSCFGDLWQDLKDCWEEDAHLLGV